MMQRMRIFTGTDHAGYELKQDLVGWLRAEGHDVVDCGAHSYDPDDDYPGFVINAVQRAVAEPTALAVVLGGSGNGEAIAANKVRGARAAVCWTPELARLARGHNDANVCSLPARFVDATLGRTIVAAFVATPFTRDVRHARRIAQISGYESGAVSPDLAVE